MQVILQKNCIFWMILGIAPNVPAVWNVFSSKKAESHFSISDILNIHPL
jgi:hypothetical protein